MELQSVAGGYRLHPLDSDAEQDQVDREHNLALRGSARPLPLLLHPQLDLQVLLRQLLLLDADTLRRAPDRPLRRLPLLLLPEHTRGQTGHRATHVNIITHV